MATALYLLLGWAAVPLAPGHVPGARGRVRWRSSPPAGSSTASVRSSTRPDGPIPFPRVFGYHEVFHALVIAAAGLHFAVAAGAVRALAG